MVAWLDIGFSDEAVIITETGLHSAVTGREVAVSPDELLTIPRRNMR
ncbi:MAG: hypothetical protein OXD46_12585 [Chloroflexi bacterium]|nr:hypothetical protein [Chloroflexota bacterium]